MEKNPALLENEFLLKEIEKAGISISNELHSIILVGGMGTRLDPQRKLISKEHFPEIKEEFHGKLGPKGMAIMGCPVCSGKITKTMTDWHLDMHAACPNVKTATLSLGTGYDIVSDYYEKKHNKRYRHIELNFLIEKNPAGTLAPIIKLHQTGKLPIIPTVLANGDNFLDIDLYKSYLAGCLLAHNLGLNLNEVIISLLAFVPWEQSNAYGTVDVDFDTGLVRGFKEKAPIEQNTFIEINNKKMTPISSGLSIIINPSYLMPKYLTKKIVETSNKLESGEPEYKENEKIVKYETLYERIAADKKMVAVHAPVYWTDLGVEEKLISAEENLANTNFFKKFHG